MVLYGHRSKEDTTSDTTEDTKRGLWVTRVNISSMNRKHKSTSIAHTRDIIILQLQWPIQR
jgi:hypothetical protein